MRIIGRIRAARRSDRGRDSVANAHRPCERPNPVRPECSLPSAPMPPPASAQRQIHWAAEPAPAQHHRAALATAWNAHTSSATPSVQPRWPQPRPWPSSQTPGRPPPAPSTAPAVLDPSSLRPLRRCNDCELAGFSISWKDGFAERLLIRTGTSASRYDSRQEPYAVVPHVRICAGAGSNPRPYRDPSAARRCMNSSGDITKCVVPSRHGVLSLSTTCPAALVCTRSSVLSGARDVTELHAGQ